MCPITQSPTLTPTSSPSQSPSRLPTLSPTLAPTTEVPSSTPTAPPSSRPTAVPSSAPTMPPTLIHLTLPWSGYSTGSGGCTYSGGVIQYMNAGSMTWKNCIYAASQRGAMLFGSVYTTMPAWGAHRLSGVAEYVSSWSVYSSLSIFSSGTCLLGRDPNAGLTNNQIPSSTITYENDVWFYQDMGALYYDQCQNAAGVRGASIITPVYYLLPFRFCFII